MIGRLFQRKAPSGAARSPKWGQVRAAYLRDHPTCELCGGTAKLECHHIKPFHLHPELELDPQNLITLCESGAGGLNCHLAYGHLGNFQKYFNPSVRVDAARWLAKLRLAKAGMT